MKFIPLHHPALAAIAAALALSPVPAFAQEVAPQPATAAPPVATPAPAPKPAPKMAPKPAPTPAPTPPVLKLPVSVATPPTPKATPKAAPSPALEKAVDATAEQTSEEAKASAKAEEVAKAAAPGAKKAAPKVSGKTRPTSSSGAVIPSGAATGSTVGAMPDNIADALPTTDAAPTDPALPVPLGEASVEGTTTATDAETGIATAPVTQNTQNDTTMPIWPWAVGGLAALGIAGFGMTMRRRREADMAYDDEYADEAYVAPAPEPVASVPAPHSAIPAHEPAPFVATGAALAQDEEAEQAVLRAEVAKMEAQLRAEAQEAKAAKIASVRSISDRMREPPAFAEGVGYHESIVDDGPTPDNPFKTRKARLKRARQLDRDAEESVQAGRATPVIEPAPPMPPVKAAPTPTSSAAAAAPEVGSLTQRLAAHTPPRASLTQTAAPRTTRTISFGSKHKLAN